MRSCSLPRALTTTIGVPMPLAAGCLDQLPAVEERQHQVEDADVGTLEAQPRDAGLAVPDPQRVEPGLGKVRSHALGDELIVLDDQYLRHLAHPRPRPGRAG